MQPYLSFQGDCAQAFAFYAQALGGKITFLHTFGESPMAAQTPTEHHGKVMHATVEGRGFVLMGSDLPPGMAFDGYKGFSLSVQGKDVADGAALFQALGAGGTVTMPFGPTFWAKGFGMLIDQFGVPWMVNCEH
jgi:PhnB protein